MQFYGRNEGVSQANLEGYLETLYRSTRLYTEAPISFCAIVRH
jgi:hypothetical protein